MRKLLFIGGVLLPSLAWGDKFNYCTGCVDFTGPTITSTTLPSGSTQYIQNRNSLQSGATFYVSSGTVAGTLSVTGTSNKLSLGYDALNYSTTTVGSTGITTAVAVGSGGQFDFQTNHATTDLAFTYTNRGLVTFGLMPRDEFNIFEMMLGNATDTWVRMWGGTQGTAMGRLDLNASQVFINGSLFPQGSILLTRSASFASSAATQHDSFTMGWQSDLWNGSAETFSTALWYNRASLTENGIDFLAAQLQDVSGTLQERMTIRNDNGNVGIGTSAPQTLLHLSSGTLTIDGSSTTSIIANGLVNANSLSGSGLSTCGDSTHALAWSSSNNLFSCQSIAGTGSGGSSALAVGIGSATWTNQISSPTAAVAFDRSQFNGSLQGGATAFISVAYSSNSITGNYTTVSTDSFVNANCASACTVTLGTPVFSGKVLMIAQTGAGNVTLSPASGNISGGSTALMNQQYSELDVLWDGKSWWVK